jgi:diguanylate cyclase (GGDEF)-like protein
MIAFRNVTGYPLVVGAIATEELYLTGWRQGLYGIILTTALSLILVFVGVKLLLRSLRANFKNQHLANHDALTGLPNRLLFADRLQQTLVQAERNKTKFALAFIDLDNLKFINDNYSHAAGDIALCEVANRMLNHVRSSDTVARIGGDEFVLLLPNIENTGNALAITEKVRAALLERFSANGQELVTGASIGVALFPDHGDSASILSTNADKAMYRAKSGGKNRVCLFDPLIDNQSN